VSYSLNAGSFLASRRNLFSDAEVFIQFDSLLAFQQTAAAVVWISRD